MNVCHVNVRSLLAATRLIDLDILCASYELDVLCLSETWLSTSLVPTTLASPVSWAFRRQS